MKGGAPQKRPRITVGDLKAKDNDIDMVKNCFEFVFVPERFIQDLKGNSRDKLVEYYTKIEARSTEQIANTTIDYIVPYITLKDWSYYG